MESTKIICSNKENLPDIRNIKIDSSLPPTVRTAMFMSQVRETNRFRVGDTVVEMGWADTDRTLQDILQSVLQAKC